MAAMVDSFQRYLLPILLIGIVTGVLALIPKVGWLLGFAAFVLAIKYLRRETLFTDLMVTMVIWASVQLLAVQVHFIG